MRPGTRILVVADWSSFRGRRGRIVTPPVVSMGGRPFVILDGDEQYVPMAFGEREIAIVEDEPHVTAGE